jgi:hypothetical protein
MPMRVLVGSEEWTYVNDPDGHTIRWQDRRAPGSQLGSMLVELGLPAALTPVHSACTRRFGQQSCRAMPAQAVDHQRRRQRVR